MKTIFLLFSGNLNQNSTIVIRYHGTLTENDANNSTEYSMFYYFDEAENDKKVIKLHKCTKCVGECYCATIDLDINHRLNFGFFDGSNKYEINTDKAFQLEIAPDPISNIMQRYGFEQNTNLPVIEDKNSKSFAMQNILNAIKEFFGNLFKKTRSV